MSSNLPVRQNKKTFSRVFWGISSFEVLAMFRRGLFYSYLSIYLRYFLGLTVTETTFLATFPMILNTLFQTFVWGHLSDKYQLRRTLIICGEFLAGVGTIIVWYGHTLPHNLHVSGYVIILGLSGVEIFWSMSNIGRSALISDLYRQEERNAVLGRLASVGGLGRLAGVWIGGFLYDGLNLQYAGWGFHKGVLFFIASGVMFISILPMLFVPEGGITQSPDSLDMQQTDKKSTASTKLFILFLIAMVFINWGRNSVAIILAQYLVLESGFAVSSQVLGYITNAESLAIIMMGLVAGWIGKRIGDGKSLLFGTAIAMISLLLFAMAMELKLIYLSNFLRGCSDVIIVASSYAFASVLIPAEKRARRFSLFNATLFLSWGLAGTLITGPLIDLLIASGTTPIFAYQMAFVAAVFMTGMGFIIQGVIVFWLMPKFSLSKAHHSDGL